MKNQDVKSPRLARWIFERSLHEARADEVLGDLEETYARMQANGGSRWARLWYWGQLFRSFPFFLFGTAYWGTVMLKNQLKTILRTLRTQSGYAILNITGLSVGIALSILALLYVQHEYSFDTSLSKADRIYRVIQDINLPKYQLSTATVGYGLAQSFTDNFPEVSLATRISKGTEKTLTYGDAVFKANNLYAVDRSILELFDIEIVRGNAKEPLATPESFVISESIAKKIFGEEDPIGKVVAITSNALAAPEMTITAVARDMPANSHFRFDFLYLYTPRPNTTEPTAGWGYIYTYIVLPEDYPPERLEAKFPDFVERFIGPEVEQWGASSWEEIKKSGRSWTLHIQALKDVHWDTQYATFDLQARYGGTFGRQASSTSVKLFSIIAFFILVLACVNFMNLATARSSRRLKEVGIRKVVGSSRMQLIHQFLLESVIISLLSLLVACALVVLLLPAFNVFLGTEINFHLLENAYLLPGLIILALTVGVLAGSYPAFFLSAFRPVELFTGMRRGGVRAVSLRDGLVVFQFLITILLIVATVVVQSQLSFMRNKDLGFEDDQVLILRDIHTPFARTRQASFRQLLEKSGYDLDDFVSLNHRQRNEVIENSKGVLHRDELPSRVRVFKQRLLEIPGVYSVSGSDVIPGRFQGWNETYGIADASAMGEVQVLSATIDTDFWETLQIELVAGRNFGTDDTSEGTIIINEAYADWLGSDDPVGSMLGDLLEEAGYKRSPKEGMIIGVTKDFQFADMRTRIQPTKLFLPPLTIYLST